MLSSLSPKNVIIYNCLRDYEFAPIFALGTQGHYCDFTSFRLSCLPLTIFCIQVCMLRKEIHSETRAHCMDNERDTVDSLQIGEPQHFDYNNHNNNNNYCACMYMCT